MQYRIIYNKTLEDYLSYKQDTLAISKFIDADDLEQAITIFKNTTSNFYTIRKALEA